jgi:hypothetical protein
MLEGEGQDHGGIASRGLNVLVSLATVDETFAGDAVVIETNRHSKRLIPEP